MFTFFPLIKGAVKQSVKFFSFLLVFGFICSFSTQIIAQDLPVYAYFQPSQFEDGDEISLVVKVGDENNQAEDIEALQLKIPYDLFDIDPFSNIEVDAGGSSWFGGDGAYYGNHTIDHENSEIVINLFRTGAPVGGFGYTTTMYGIIVEMEEIYGKQQIEPGEITLTLMEDVKAGLGISWSLGEEAQEIQLINQGQSSIEGVKLYNLSGQLVLQQVGNVSEINASQLSPQAYILEVSTDKGSFSEKVLVR